MKENRFSMNIILVIIAFASAVTFFVTIKVTRTASVMFGLNTYNPIEDTEYFIKSSNIEPNGLYKGSETVYEIVSEGEFGDGTNAAIDGDRVYVNEFELTSLGVKLSRVVGIDVNTGKKSVIVDDAELMGKCASGELVIIDSAAARSNNADSNSLCMLYSLSGNISFGKSSAVIFYDTEKQKVVYTTDYKPVNEKLFRIAYLDRTLQEVKK